MKYKTFVDIDPSFIANPVTKDLAILNDSKAILFSIKNLVLTNYYERPFNSSLGSPVYQLLFDIIDSDQFSIVMKRAVFDVINTYEPRVDVTDVSVVDSPDNNRIYLKIQANIKNTRLPIMANITLERTR